MPTALTTGTRRLPRLTAFIAAITSIVGCGGCGGAPFFNSTASYDYMHGDYLQAAEEYDQQFRTNHSDAARDDRDGARRAALRVMLAAVTAQRKDGNDDVSIKLLGQFLAYRATWGTPLEPATADALPAEITAAGAYIKQAVSDRLADRGLASADALARSYDAVLLRPEFATWRNDLHARLVERGKFLCPIYFSELPGNKPFILSAVTTYCKRWGAADQVVPPLPNVHANLVVDGQLAGEHDDELARLRAALAAAFRASAWFSPTATDELHATLDGRLTMTSQTKVVPHSKDWTQAYTYPTTETVTVATQEPYAETRTRAVTRDGVTEERSRTVTKYRTVEHEETRDATGVASRTNTLNYQESELTGEYTATIHLQLGPELGGITVALDDHDVQHGLERDTDAPWAYVTPSHIPLMTLSQFATQEEARLTAKLQRALDEQYAKQFCRANSIDPEDAARCAYLDPSRLDKSAHWALAKIFGKDEPEVAKLFVRPTRP